MSVQIMLHATFGHDFAAGTGDSSGCPISPKGCWPRIGRSSMTRTKAEPGDVAVQNGQHDGGNPGGRRTMTENHVGIVVKDPDNGQLAIMNNSASHRSFINLDMSIASSTTTTSPRRSRPRYYRREGQSFAM